MRGVTASSVADDGDEAPAGLGRAPSEPSSPTPSAYRDYVQALVDALG